MSDDLGDRMKAYEKATIQNLPENLPVIIRIDGKAFHTFCRGMEKPFDDSFIEMMNAAALGVCNELQNCRMAYLQSDEISFLVMKDIYAGSWFDHDVQKLTSITASMATLAATRYQHSFDFYPNKKAIFDSRCFVLPEKEVVNYFLWRQRDWMRNSVHMMARSWFSQKKLNNMGVEDMKAMLISEGTDWNAQPTMLKFGRTVVKFKRYIPTPELEIESVLRNVWEVDNKIPYFGEDREYIKELFMGLDSEKPKAGQHR